MPHHLHIVAIDLAKKVFHLVGSDMAGTILWRKRLTRHALMPFIAQLPPVRIGIEACGGAHYWARRFREHGHEVKLIAPQFVKPFVKSNKNDMRDAEAIAEAVTRPTMRFVPAKDIPTVSHGVTCAVVDTYGCDDGRISPTHCAVIAAGLDGR
jgi:transposase